MTKNEIKSIVTTAFKHKIPIKESCEKLGYSYSMISNKYAKQLALAIDAWIRENIINPQI